MKRLVDPRIEAIRNRFSKIKHTVMIASGKGGVGKSLIASTLSLILSQRNKAVGLLDLDLHGPVTHVLFKLDEAELKESKDGLIPPVVNGVKVMSLGLLARNRPTPISGANKRDAIREILAVTRWDSLDILVIDLPPGTGDEVLETVNLLREKSSIIAITTPSKLSITVVSRLIDLLKAMKAYIAGLLENMAYLKINGIILYPLGEPKGIELAREKRINYLGKLPLDPEIPKALEQGPRKLVDTMFARELARVVEVLEGKMR